MRRLIKSVLINTRNLLKVITTDCVLWMAMACVIDIFGQPSKRWCIFSAFKKIGMK